MNIKVWFTSDTHFGSEKSLVKSCRPFRTVDEMDNTIISNWNRVVGDNDIVFHLGDFGNFDVVNRLNGKIMLIAGNHELYALENDSNFISTLKDKFINSQVNDISVFDDIQGINIDSEGILKTLDIWYENGIDLVMSHRPDDCFRYLDIFNQRNKHRTITLGSFGLFGHIHGLGKVKRFGLNVGVDCHNFTPISIDTVRYYRDAIQNTYEDCVFME